MVGAGTIRADNPKLTTRRCAGTSPVRVVIDTDRRLDAAHVVFQEDPTTLLLAADDTKGPNRLGRAEVLSVEDYGAVPIPKDTGRYVAAPSALEMLCPSMKCPW